MLEDCQIIPSPTWNSSMNPNNWTVLDTKSHLPPHPWPRMFVTVPALPEVLEIWNGCVCSIHGDQGIIENVIGMSILPHNHLALK